MKATHYGECQVCGHRQKLPNGRLSLHGYAVRAGFFEGTCMGSKNLPLELDKSMIDRSIAMAEERLASARAGVAAQEDGTGQLVYRAYDGYARHRILANRLVDVIEVSEDGSFTYTQPTLKTVATNRTVGRSRAHTIEQLRKDRAWHLNEHAREIERYIGWQKQRIHEWAPRPLQPIEQPVTR